MFLRKKLIVALLVVFILIIGMGLLFLRIQFPTEPTADEFAVYDAFLARLSADWPSNPVYDAPFIFALADTSSNLVERGYDEHIPWELRPSPPEKSEPSESMANFCGWLCGHDFIRKNLRSWHLTSASTNTQFRLNILPRVPDATSAKREVRLVSVTRAGFDFRHRRAGFNYTFDCGRDGTSVQRALLCGQSGQVLLEKENGVWQVREYTGMMF
jgi:hypothetical protein